MLLKCACCSQDFDFSEPLQIGERHLSCPRCSGSLKMVTAVKIEAMQEAQPPSTLSEERAILVAVEGNATQEMIQEVLTENGYKAILAATAEEALRTLDQYRPSVALLDVGLPGIAGFELCERIRKSERLRNTKIILVASIYDKTRYKREPESLYGADDYIERHHIQDGLIPKIEVLLDQRAEVPRQTPVVHSVETAPQPAEGLRSMDDMLLEEATVYEPSPPAVCPEPQTYATSAAAQNGQSSAVAGDPAKHEAARRLARLILSEIALYNHKAVEDGIRNHTFRELVKDQLEEGRKLYCLRVSSDIAAVADYYEQAIQEFIQKRKGTS